MSDPEVSIRDLYSRFPAEREAAIARLVSVGTPAVTPLIAFVRDCGFEGAYVYPEGVHHPGVKKDVMLEAVYRTLQGIGEPAVAPLVPLMRHRDSGVRKRAGEALHGIGPPAATALIDLLQCGEESVSAAAAAALAGIEDARATGALRKALRSNSHAVRAAAAAALAGRNDEETITALRQTLLNAVAENRRVRTRRALYVVGAYGAIFVLLALAGIISGHRWQVTYNLLIQGMVQLGIGLVAFDATANVRKSTVTALGQSADPRMAGAFALCLSDQSAEIRKAASNVLKELLPKLQESDRSRFSSAEREALVKALGGKDEALTLAILKALEQIGDDQALARVQELSARGSAAVRSAAADCLPFLQARAEEARQARTLLRASQPEPSGDELLRPAQAEPETPTEQLLRPT